MAFPYGQNLMNPIPGYDGLRRRRTRPMAQTPPGLGRGQRMGALSRAYPQPGYSDLQRTMTSAQDLTAPSLWANPLLAGQQQQMQTEGGQQRVAELQQLRNFMAAGGAPAQPAAAPIQAGMGDPTLGRHMPAAFSTLEAAPGVNLTGHSGLGPLPSDVGVARRAAEAEQFTAQQARAGDILRRAPTAFTATASPGDPTAWEDFKTRQGMALADARAGRETVTEAWAGPADLDEWTKHQRNVQALAAGDLSVPPSTRYTAGDPGKRTSAKLRRQIELGKRGIMLDAKRQGQPMPAWMARVGAKTQLGQPLTAAEEKKVDLFQQQQQLATIPAGQRGQVMAAREAAGAARFGAEATAAATRYGAESLERIAAAGRTPEAYAQDIEVARAPTGITAPAEFEPAPEGAPLAGLSEYHLQQLSTMTPTQKAMYLRDQLLWGRDRVDRALPSLTGDIYSRAGGAGGISDWIPGIGMAGPIPRISFPFYEEKKRRRAMFPTKGK